MHFDLNGDWYRLNEEFEKAKRRAEKKKDLIEELLSDLDSPEPELKSFELGIHFTQVIPRCSMCLRGGLSTRPARVRGTLRQRRGLSRLSVRVALAGGFPLSGMRA